MQVRLYNIFIKYYISQLELTYATIAFATTMIGTSGLAQRATYYVVLVKDG